MTEDFKCPSCDAPKSSHLVEMADEEVRRQRKERELKGGKSATEESEREADS